MPAVIRFFVFFFFFYRDFHSRVLFLANPDSVVIHGLFFVFFKIKRSFCFVLFQIFMYSSVGSILLEATVGRLAAGAVDGRG